MGNTLARTRTQWPDRPGGAFWGTHAGRKWSCLDLRTVGFSIGPEIASVWSGSKPKGCPHFCGSSRRLATLTCSSIPVMRRWWRASSRTCSRQARVAGRCRRRLAARRRSCRLRANGSVLRPVSPACAINAPDCKSEYAALPDAVYDSGARQNIFRCEFSERDKLPASTSNAQAWKAASASAPVNSLLHSPGFHPQRDHTTSACATGGGALAGAAAHHGREQRPASTGARSGRTKLHS